MIVWAPVKHSSGFRVSKVVGSHSMTIQEGGAGKIESQDNPHYFFRLCRHHSQRICAPKPNCDSGVLRECPWTLVCAYEGVRPEMWKSEAWYQLHDNAPAHTAIAIRQFMARKRITVLEHPPYSPDLAPADFMLFPKLKMVMKGHHFDDIETIQKNVTAVLNSIPAEAFRRAFDSLYERSQKCVQVEGMYIEN